jgi:integrase
MTTETKKRTKRRGNGEGSIYQRANGRWEAVITVGYNATGKRVRRTLYGWTKKEVQDGLTSLQSRKLDGSLSETSKLTVASFLSRWLETVARPGVRATSLANYRRAVNNHIAPMIGGIPLAKLTPAHVQGLYAEMEREGKSGYIRRQAHIVMRSAFKQAVKWGIIPRNVCDAVDQPRLPQSHFKTLDAEQCVKFLDAARGEKLEAAFVVALGTGLRLGEIFGLQWADVDLQGGSIFVRHTLTELAGRLSLSEPKTPKSRRRVALPAVVVEALHEHRKRELLDGHAATTWVFHNRLGRPLRRAGFYVSHFKPLLKKAGLPDMHFHGLRHTFASLLLSASVHPKIVQEALGHTTISMTLDTYSHLLPTMQAEAAVQLDRLLTPAIGKKAARA